MPAPTRPVTAARGADSEGAEDALAPAPDAAAGAPGPVRGWSRAWEALAALAVLLLLAVLLFKGVWLDRRGTLAGIGSDPDLLVWYLAWAPWAVSHLHNPLVTHQMLAPGGANLMWNVSIILPALLFWPVTAAVGPIWSYDMLVTLAPALSGWAAYFVLRRYASWLGALAGAVLYGFSPVIVSQSQGHPMVTMAAFPPVAWLLLRTIVGSSSRRRRLLAGAALGLASAGQLLTGTEMLAITVIASAAGLGILALLQPRVALARARPAAEALGAALVVGAAFGAYPLAVLLFGPLRMQGAVQPQNVFVQDLVGLVVPGPSQATAWPGAIAIANHITGNTVEVAGYLGVPLLVVAAVVAFRLWHRTAVRWAALTTAVIVLLALGPRLHVHGEVLRLPLPWRVFEKLPLLQSLLPVRFMVLAYLTLGLLVALGVDLARSAARPALRAGALLAGALVAVSLLPNPISVETPRTPAFFTGAGVQRLPEDGLVVISPQMLDYSAMRFQALAGMRFRMTDGGAFTPYQPGPVFGPTPSPLTDELLAAESSDTWSLPPADRLAAVRSQLASLGVDAVVVAPQPQEDRVVRLMTAVLGSPPESVDGVELWLARDGRGLGG